MKVESIESVRERQVIIALATDDLVLAHVAPKWGDAPGPLASSYANRIGGWCIRHFNRYGKAPKVGLKAYYERWVENARSQDEADAVAQLLASLSSEYEQGNEVSSEQMIDLAMEYINTVKIRRMLQASEADLALGQLDRAIERVQAFTKEESDKGVNEDTLLAQDEVFDTFAGKEESLINLPDGLGDFFCGELARDSFVAFQGPEKSSKSFMLMELAYQALITRKRVAFFEVGDMTRRQFKRRLMSRIAQHPWRSPTQKWPCTIRIPTAITKPPKGELTATVKFRQQEFAAPLSAKQAWLACQRIMEKHVKSTQSYFKLSVHSNSSINVAGIRAKLHAWEMAGWVPDCVFVDYADILASPDPRMEYREAINETWKQLRRLSQDLHCLVVTATQADADSYTKEVQDRRNFSEDKRKNSHVTGMVGINVSSKDKEQGIVRLNWIEARDIDFSTKRCCHVATCLALANPMVVSVF